MVHNRLYGNNGNDPHSREDRQRLRKENRMILSLVAAITTKLATEMVLSGAAASITFLCAGTRARKRK